jgi:hypothetical protein
MLRFGYELVATTFGCAVAAFVFLALGPGIVGDIPGVKDPNAWAMQNMSKTFPWTWGILSAFLLMICPPRWGNQIARGEQT